jgi:hypothetical protein
MAHFKCPAALHDITRHETQSGALITHISKFSVFGAAPSHRDSLIFHSFPIHNIDWFGDPISVEEGTRVTKVDRLEPLVEIARGCRSRRFIDLDMEMEMEMEIEMEMPTGGLLSFLKKPIGWSPFSQMFLINPSIHEDNDMKNHSIRRSDLLIIVY